MIKYERSFFNCVNGEWCIYNTIEIIKRYQPKVYVIENPLASRMWSYIADVLDFAIPFDNPTYYGNYNYREKVDQVQKQPSFTTILMVTLRD